LRRIFIGELANDGLLVRYGKKNKPANRKHGGGGCNFLFNIILAFQFKIRMTLKTSASFIFCPFLCTNFYLPLIVHL